MIYAAVSFLFIGRSLIGGFGSRYIGREADPTQMMWLFEWWPYAIAHHLNLFITHLVWAPVGFNLASMTSIPLLALLAYPLTRTVGLVPAYNVLALIAPASAALSAFALCRYLTRRFWPSLFGGYLFGFSAYMLGQTLGHLCLTMVFAVPLMVLLASAKLNGDIEAIPFVILLALTLAAQFFVDMEVFAVAVIFGALTFAAAIYCSAPSDRQRYYAQAPLIGASIALATLILSPYLYYYLLFPQLKQPFWPSEGFSTDLLNLFLPTPVNLLGAGGWAASISKEFPGRLMERGGYIAAPIFFVIFSWARANRREPTCKTILLMLAVIVVATLGPWLHLCGRILMVMPWIAFVRMPLLEHILPARLMLITALLLAIIGALWTADPRVSLKSKLMAAAVTVLMMLPNPNAAFWSSPVEAPEFFSQPAARATLHQNDVVLTLPWGDRGSSMLWQAQCGMCFRNVGGWTGVHRFPIRRWPIVSYFLGARDLPEPELQFKAFVANTGVTSIVVDDSGFRANDWNSLAQTLGVERTRISGLSIYRITPGLLDQYRAMSALEMESRANRLRFGITLRAVNAYLQGGDDPSRISVDRLSELGYLPATWHSEKGAMTDLFVTSPGNAEFGIAEYGSPSGLRAVIEAYRQYANKIYFPFPQLIWERSPQPWWIRLCAAALVPPSSGPVDGESMHMVAIYFDRSQLRQVAANQARNKR